MTGTIPKRLDPNTAVRDRSIWMGINRAVLEHQTQWLCHKQHLAGRRRYTGSSDAVHETSYPLPLKVEQSLADDLAFIAACQPQVHFVSAVAIEQSEAEPSLVAKLATNEGVTPEVANSFDRLFEVLRAHARREITREQCQEQLLALIVELNCNKILGRLGSNKFKRPAHLNKTQGPLPGRLRELFRKHVQAPSRHRARPEVNKLDGQIKSFEAAFEQVEAGVPANITPSLTHAIKQAFVLTEDGVKLPDRLRALGCPSSLLDARDVREIGKLSNYWRISRHLAICSQSFRAQFAKCEWHPLPSYKSSSSPSSSKRQHVHAEIQLLVHYEVTTPRLMPRWIGVSKEACFLCDSFIRAHRRFHITGAHRQMFPQWIVPDLAQYSLETIKHFRQVLSEVHGEVLEEYRKAQKPLPWHAFPLQSAINLNVVLLNTPSASTLPLSQSYQSDSSHVVTRVSHASGSLMSSLAEQRLHLEDHNNDVVFENLTIREPQSHVKYRESIATKTSLVTVVNEAQSEHSTWVRIFASIDEPLTSQPVEKGSVSIGPVSSSRCQRTISMAEVPSHEGVTLERVPSDDLYELSFILIGPQKQQALVSCRWPCP